LVEAKGFFSKVELVVEVKGRGCVDGWGVVVRRGLSLKGILYCDWVYA